MTGAIPSYVITLMNRLNAGGFECFAVGGAVRSLLLDLPVHDWDLTTDARPEQMKEIFRGYRTIETGIRHGTLTVMSDGNPVEITTYRKETTYQDHRHPDSVEFTSAVREDCARRDFTINAMCMGADETVHDFFEGRKDLNNRVMRCIGIADERFSEDALRIMRCLRFAAVLSFSIEEETAAALHRNRNLLSYISEERIHAELNSFFEAPSCASLLREYRDVFEVFIPELKQLKNDEWETAVLSIERSPADRIIRMALLLHAAGSLESILRRLKYSLREIRSIISLCGGVSKPLESVADIRRAIRDYGDETELFFSFRCALDTALNKQILMDRYHQVINNGDCCSRRQLAVNGRDLQEAGLSGSQISEMLDLLLEETIEKRLPNSRCELLEFVHEHKKRWQ